MTEVAFHFNVPDRLAYTCRLVRKAYAAGGRTVVVAPAGAGDGAAEPKSLGDALRQKYAKQNTD